MSGGPYVYDYPRPALTVDIAVFAWTGERLEVLLIRRGSDPFAGLWALPGGFVEEGEDFEIAARRELKEETGLGTQEPIWFVGNYGKLGRDPRRWTVSVAYAAAVRRPKRAVKGSDDASDAAWRPVDETNGRLAFDHDEILRDARRSLGRETSDGRAGPALLPTRFDRAEAGRLLKAAGATTGPSAWLKRRIKSGEIESVAGDPARFRRVGGSQ